MARRLVALCWLLLLACSAPAAAQTFPAFTGLVVDDAHVLPPDVQASLTAKLEALQKRTGRQFVVATIGDMQGYPLEDYGYRLGRTWGVGLKDADNGAILFIAPNNPAGQRGPRIEVGRRLEPVLTDAMASVIITQTMLPKLRAGDVPGAMTAGTDAVVTQLALPDEEARARAVAAARGFDQQHARRGSDGGGTVAIGFFLIVLAFALIAMRSRRGGVRRRFGGASGLPIILWGPGGGLGGGSGGSGWSGGGGSSSGPDGSWFGGGFTGGGGGDFGGGGASGDW